MLFIGVGAVWGGERCGGLGWVHSGLSWALCGLVWVLGLGACDWPIRASQDKYRAMRAAVCVGLGMHT